MMSTMDTPESKNHLDDEAYGRMQLAVSLITQGSWKEAASALEKAARLHAHAGRSYDEARCLQLAASLHRSAGETEKGRGLIEEAGQIAQPDDILAVSIAAERAETAWVEGRYQDAVTDWTMAIDTAQTAGLAAGGLSAMLRRRAAASVKLGRIEDLLRDYDEACRVIAPSQGIEVVHLIRIEEATALCEQGWVNEAEQVLTRLKLDFVDHSASSHVMAELLTLRARMARVSGQYEAAVEMARRSRDAALQAVVPVSYFAANVELAESLSAMGDLSTAYGTLATAWVTLSDLLGKDVAASWVEPCLLGYKIRWGDEVFQKAKATYETQRRGEKNHGTRSDHS